MSTKSTNLFYFLVKLAEDTDFQREYSKDVARVATDFGLTTDEVALLKEGDEKKILKAAVGDDPDYRIAPMWRIFKTWW